MDNDVALPTNLPGSPEATGGKRFAVVIVSTLPHGAHDSAASVSYCRVSTGSVSEHCARLGRAYAARMDLGRAQRAAAVFASSEAHGRGDLEGAAVLER